MAATLSASPPARRRGTLSRAAGTFAILRHWPGQRRAPFLSRKELGKRRDRAVRDTVRYAAKNVPHYAGLLRRDGVDPRTIRRAEDLAALPIIGRGDVLQRPEDFRSSARAAKDGLFIRTSGTSGHPLDVFHDRRSALANIAFSERERAVETGFLIETGLLGGRRRYRVLALDYRTATLFEVRAFYDAAAFRPARPRLHHVPSDEPIERTLEALDRLRPDVVLGPGSWLEVVFRTIAERNRATHLPKLVLYGGAALSEEGWQLIQGELGVPVLSRYNAGEAFKIGYLCEARAGFHLHEDLCHVELVDENGETVPEGERGSVVISNLVNRGMVFLRYRLGDFARITSEPCTCGRPSRRLLGLEGKRAVIIRLPDGRFLHARTIWGVVKEAEGIRRFQVVQHERGRFEIRLEAVDRAAFDRSAKQIEPGLHTLLTGCAVEVTYHEALRPEPGRPFEPMVALNDTPGA